MRDWTRMKAGILGAGVENIALMRFLLNKGVAVTLHEQQEWEKVEERLKDLFVDDNLTIRCGKDYLHGVNDQNILFRSPGMRLEKAKSILTPDMELSSAMKLFFEICPAKIIGVTGTKGKGTTCAIITEILKKTGKNVYLVGNIGNSPFDIIDHLKSDDWVVVELSSFQLQDMENSPHIAAVLGITPDHLDSQSLEHPNFHNNFEEYVKAKQNIVRYQGRDDFAVLVKVKPTQEFANCTKAHVDYCQTDEDEGCFTEDGWVVIKHQDNKEQVLRIDEIPLKGKHNLINAQVAAMVGYLAGSSVEMIAEGIKRFQGLPHRLQLIGEVEGIKYFDDSYATGPQPTIAAVESFSEPIVLIAGGSSKGADFNELAEVIKKSSVKGIILIGEEAEKIKTALEKVGVSVPIKEGLITMREAVNAASELAKEGEVVLLSPACASFDMFKNATDRAEQFKKAVQGI